MPGMSPNDSPSFPAGLSAEQTAEHVAVQVADTMIERRYPSDIDRLREAVGTDVLPFYRDEQAIVASQQASERWPYLVAVANSRGAPSTLSTQSAHSSNAAHASHSSSSSSSMHSAPTSHPVRTN